jgi:Na+-translocating ferredoxin:NAD+ oxidoreductase RnfC subunit
VEEYEAETPFEQRDYRPAAVRIKLRQHAGAAAKPVVAEGAAVSKGQTIGRVEVSELGAAIHSSIDGVAHRITGEFIEITA